MNALFIEYAMDSLLESVQAVSDFFLAFAGETQERTAALVGDLAEGFLLSVERAKQGAGDLIKGVAGMIFAPIALTAVVAVIPAIILAWTALFCLSAIAHSLTVPAVYIWYLYQRLKESIAPEPATSVDYFPESTVPVVATLTPPLLVVSAITLLASIGIESEPAPQAWTPSFIPLPTVQEEIQEPQVDIVDIEAFRAGLEQQFNIQPRTRTWKSYILQNLVLPKVEVPLVEEPLLLEYPSCEINPDTQIEIVQQYAVRETVSPFPTPTTSCTDEVERSLPVEVPTAPEFPAKPSNKVLQRWETEQLVLFCDRINAVKKGSITKYKKASKTLLVKKIKEFYNA